MREGGKSGIHWAEDSVFARMTGKNRHFLDLSQQVLSGVVALIRETSKYRAPPHQIPSFYLSKIINCPAQISSFRTADLYKYLSLRTCVLLSRITFHALHIYFLNQSTHTLARFLKTLACASTGSEPETSFRSSNQNSYN